MGAILFRILNPNGVDTFEKASIQDFFQMVKWTGYHFTYYEHWSVLVAAAAFLIFVATQVFRRRSRIQRRAFEQPEKGARIYMFYSFLLLTVPTILFATCITQYLASRYYGVFFFGAVIAACLLVIDQAWSNPRIRLALSALALTCCVASSVLYLSIWDRPRHFDYYPEVVKCIDDAAERHQLSSGVAPYWYANSTSALSRTDLNVLPVHPDLKVYLWILNRSRIPDTFDFAVIPSKAARDTVARTNFVRSLLTSNGSPRERVPCPEEREVWIYGPEGLRLP